MATRLDRLRDRAAADRKRRLLAPLENVAGRALTRMWDDQRDRLARLLDRLADERSATLGDLWPRITRATAPPAAATIQAATLTAARHGQTSPDLPRPAAATPSDVAGWVRGRGGIVVQEVDGTTRDQLGDLLAEAARERWPKQAVADAIAARFDGYTPSRANRVAVTAMNDAFEAGKLHVAQQILAQGVPLQQRWLTVGDGACPVCTGNAVTGWMPFGLNFPSGDRRPPQHPNCRCTLLTRPAR